MYDAVLTCRHCGSKRQVPAGSEPVEVEYWACYERLSRNKWCEKINVTRAKKGEPR